MSVSTKRQELEQLKRGKWQNDRIPEIMTARQAYAAQAPGRRFYTVAWWGTEEKPLPAGFTYFDFQVETGGEYVVIWRDEPRDQTGIIPADELVLMFSD